MFYPTSKGWIAEMLKDKKFEKGFDLELRAARLAVEIALARDRQGMTQAALAFRAGITQQQLSKIENSKACKVETLLKVCGALGMDLVLSPRKEGAKEPKKRRSSGSASTRKSLPRAAFLRGKKATNKRALSA